MDLETLQESNECHAQKTPKKETIGDNGNGPRMKSAKTKGQWGADLEKGNQSPGKRSKKTASPKNKKRPLGKKQARR